jgi:Activator of Hsp90 ATPase homolog 1-like protein
MLTSSPEQTIHTLEITKEEEIAAPLEVVFETLLEHLGPLNETGPGSPLPMTLEPWPGGRWYRDLGNNAGHFWGHVQVIKPPTVLEISGPLFMSYPAISHVQYRLRAEGRVTRLTLAHRAIGQIIAEHRDVGQGWNHILRKIREAAERRGGGSHGNR